MKRLVFVMAVAVAGSGAATEGPEHGSEPSGTLAPDVEMASGRVGAAHARGGALVRGRIRPKKRVKRRKRKQRKPQPPKAGRHTR